MGVPYTSTFKEDGRRETKTSRLLSAASNSGSNKISSIIIKSELKPSPNDLNPDADIWSSFINALLSSCTIKNFNKDLSKAYGKLQTLGPTNPSVSLAPRPVQCPEDLFMFANSRRSCMFTTMYGDSQYFPLQLAPDRRILQKALKKVKPNRVLVYWWVLWARRRTSGSIFKPSKNPGCDRGVNFISKKYGRVFGAMLMRDQVYISWRLLYNDIVPQLIGELSGPPVQNAVVSDLVQLAGFLHAEGELPYGWYTVSDSATDKIYLDPRTNSLKGTRKKPTQFSPNNTKCGRVKNLRFPGDCVSRRRKLKGYQPLTIYEPLYIQLKDKPLLISQRSPEIKNYVEKHAFMNENAPSAHEEHRIFRSQLKVSAMRLSSKGLDHEENSLKRLLDLDWEELPVEVKSWYLIRWSKRTKLLMHQDCVCWYLDELIKNYSLTEVHNIFLNRTGKFLFDMNEKEFIEWSFSIFSELASAMISDFRFQDGYVITELLLRKKLGNFKSSMPLYYHQKIPDGSQVANEEPKNEHEKAVKDEVESEVAEKPTMHELFKKMRIECSNKLGKEYRGDVPKREAIKQWYREMAEGMEINPTKEVAREFGERLAELIMKVGTEKAEEEQGEKVFQTPQVSGGEQQNVVKKKRRYNRKKKKASQIPQQPDREGEEDSRRNQGEASQQLPLANGLPQRLGETQNTEAAKGDTQPEVVKAVKLQEELENNQNKAHQVHKAAKKESKMKQGKITQFFQGAQGKLKPKKKQEKITHFFQFVKEETKKQQGNAPQVSQAAKGKFEKEASEAGSMQKVKKTTQKEQPNEQKEHSPQVTIATNPEPEIDSKGNPQIEVTREENYKQELEELANNGPNGLPKKHEVKEPQVSQVAEREPEKTIKKDIGLNTEPKIQYLKSKKAKKITKNKTSRKHLTPEFIRLHDAISKSWVCFNDIPEQQTKPENHMFLLPIYTANPRNPDWLNCFLQGDLDGVLAAFTVEGEKGGGNDEEDGEEDGEGKIEGEFQELGLVKEDLL